MRNVIVEERSWTVDEDDDTVVTGEENKGDRLDFDDPVAAAFPGIYSYACG